MRIHTKTLLQTLPLLCLALALTGCRPAPAPGAPAAAVAPPGPVEATSALLEDLRRDRLAAWARASVPPELYARLDLAWREDRSRWPLTELPLDRHVPGFVVALAEPQADARLRADYRRQFAGARAELRSAAATLSLFGEQYLRHEGEYSADERAHYLQLVRALGAWGQRAPLAEAARADRAITALTRAARRSGLRSPQAFHDHGLHGTLRRLGPVYGEAKRVLADYGLDWNAALAGTTVELVSRTGDRARVRLRYGIAGAPIDAEMDLERIGGHWYLSDALRRARAEADAPRIPSAARVAGRH